MVVTIVVTLLLPHDYISFDLVRHLDMDYYNYLCANYFVKCATKWFCNMIAMGQSLISVSKRSGIVKFRREPGVGDPPYGVSFML